MSSTIIQVDLGEGGWAAIPRSVMENRELSLAARGLLSWFLTRGQGFEINVAACRVHHGLGEQAWATLATQLVGAGHYHRVTARGERGQIRTRVSITAVPMPTLPTLPSTDPGLAGTGPAGGRFSRASAGPGCNTETGVKEITPPPQPLHPAPRLTLSSPP